MSLSLRKTTGAVVGAGLLALMPVQGAQANEITADISGIYMTRDNPDSGPLVVFAGGGMPAIRSSDLEFDWAAGFDAGIHIPVNGFGAEVRVFWLDEVSASHTLIGTGVGLLFQTNPNTGYGLPLGNTLTARTSSEIYGGEINGTFPLNASTTVYAGIRAINLEEDLNFFGNFGGGASETNIWTSDNELLGAQVGARVDLGQQVPLPAGVTASVDIAIGLFHNEQRATMVTLDSGVPRYATVVDNDSATSIGVDAGVEVGYMVAPNVELFAGYNILHITNTALATDQVSGTTAFGGQPMLSLRDDVVTYHGGRVGARVRF